MKRRSCGAVHPLRSRSPPSACCRTGGRAGVPDGGDGAGRDGGAASSGSVDDASRGSGGASGARAAAGSIAASWPLRRGAFGLAQGSPTIASGAVPGSSWDATGSPRRRSGARSRAGAVDGAGGRRRGPPSPGAEARGGRSPHGPGHAGARDGANDGSSAGCGSAEAPREGRVHGLESRLGGRIARSTDDTRTGHNRSRPSAGNHPEVAARLVQDVRTLRPADHDVLDAGPVAIAR